VPSSPPPAWYPDPVEASRFRYWDGEHWTEHVAPAPAEQSRPKPTSSTWNTPETWAVLATMLVLVPVTARASGAADRVGASPWAVAAGATVIALTAAVLLESGTGRARDGVLFGVYLAFALAAITAIATALDVWDVWVMVAVVVPIVTVQWLRRRSRQGPRRKGISV
jgi:hypothetical protein